PEGIAYDAAGRHFYTGSITDGTLLRGSLDTGDVTVFSPARADGRATVLGMGVDGTRRRLWVAGGAAQRMYVYDLGSARLLRQYPVPPGSPAALINDVAVTPAGDAYFTDTQRPVLWRVGAGGQDGPGDLESWLDLSGGPVPAEPAGNLNGIVATPDGATLIAVHFRSGRLFRFGVASKEAQEIELDTPVPGGDGLALDGTTLFAAAGQIVRLDLTPDYARATRRDAFTHPSLAFPTTLRKVGDRLLVVNSQLDTLPAGRPVLPFTVADIPIPA
ncbi:MAG: SMP-30/gluconolactonase/LRE family protein, partial [Chloroflexota bacterium]|nr:SMP-30/gluconolactonase/LRE family protein [Chloroflexota bacterium]